MKLVIQAVVLIVAVGFAFGQQPADSPRPNIMGTVTDFSGALIAGAKVSLFRSAESVPIAATRTDANGEFQFFFNEVQEFRLVAEALCFTPTIVKKTVGKHDETTKLPPIILQVSQECPGGVLHQDPVPVMPVPSEISKSLDQPSNQPLKTTLCEVVTEPERFNGKMVSIRGRVLVFIGLEDSYLDTGQCAGNKFGDVWLEYGTGPKPQPTTSCCGDIVPRDPFRVVQNQDFREFDEHLTAHLGMRYLYEVTATLTGRFDAVETVTCPDGKHQCPKQNRFGDFGMSSRLVIELVSDVVAKPIDR
jgi:Carboxypeptidase regulatory-like domain